MNALLELIRNSNADSSLSFRAGIYQPGEQGDLLRDIVALANASIPGRRFLFLGIDETERQRRFPGVSARSWKRFCEELPGFIARTVEPRLPLTLQSVDVGNVLVGAVCLENCEDKPYLLSRSVSASMPAGSGWIRTGTRQRRLLRKHLQSIFASRFKPQDVGDIIVGFPGELPREELELPVLPLDELPSARAAHKLHRMLDARRVSKAVLGRTDTHIERLVHAQVGDVELPYQAHGTCTMRAMLGKVPIENAVADDHYKYEQRAHLLNLVLNNVSDKAQTDVVVTLKFPRIDGFGVADRIYPGVGGIAPKLGMYPKVDVGPRTITVQTRGLRIPRGGTVEAFFEPLRVLLREPAAGQTIRVAYTLHAPTLPQPLQGRLKILARR
jgi:hypothetical protein